MGVTCQILIKKPREGVHKSGKPVTGIVQYAVDEPSPYKDITLSLIGKGKCTWNETRYTASGRRKTVTFTGTEIYTSQYLSVKRKGAESDLPVPIGTYQCPFTFVLPKNIPSSFENSKCKIKYKLVLKFEKPQLFSINKKFDAEIIVRSDVQANLDEGNTMFGLQKTLFKPFSKKTHHIDLEAEVSNTIFGPGQNAKLTYNVTNDTDVTIPSVKTELICDTIYTANCGHGKRSTKTIKECTVETPSVPANSVANMTSIMPISPNLYSIQHSRIMFNEYKVKVTLRLPIPYVNASTEIPIVIGEKYGDNEIERYLQEVEEEPPSYFEAMQEDKEKE